MNQISIVRRVNGGINNMLSIKTFKSFFFFVWSLNHWYYMRGSRSTVFIVNTFLPYRKVRSSPFCCAILLDPRPSAYKRDSLLWFSVNKLYKTMIIVWNNSEDNILFKHLLRDYVINNMKQQDWLVIIVLICSNKHELPPTNQHFYLCPSQQKLTNLVHNFYV